jgi:ATP-dependent helicase/nuclease subunit A
MAGEFLDSDLGRRCAASQYRETEFPVISAVSAVSAGGRNIPVTGQIDLLFEEEDAVWIADFKTDRITRPEDHYGQLAVYKRAVSDIFKKPIRAWLYYLRSKNAVEISGELQAVSVEEIIASFLTEAPLSAPGEDLSPLV